MQERSRTKIKGGKPLIVFAGRSNVGKSSTIRALTGRRVRVGKRPGSTRWEFLIDLGPVILADMAGFGHMAGQSKATIEETKTTVIHKLEEWGKRIAVAILIVDVSLFRVLVERWDKRGEIPVDIEFYGFLSEISSGVVVAANKIDKVKKSRISYELDYLEMKLREVVPNIEPQIVPISASKRVNVSHLKETIEANLTKRGVEKPEW